MAETMTWGNKIGCSLLNGTCVKEIHEDNKWPRKSRKTSNFPSLFCDPITHRFACTTDRLGVGTCEPGENEWWTQPEGCPVVVPYFDSLDDKSRASGICTDENTLSTMGSIKGLDSWCVDTEHLRYKYSFDDISVGLDSVCAKILCEDGQVKVKYLGNDKDWTLCPQGGSITLASANFTEGSKIKCPNYSEVCTVALDGSSRVVPKSATRKET